MTKTIFRAILLTSLGTLLLTVVKPPAPTKGLRTAAVRLPG